MNIGIQSGRGNPLAALTDLVGRVRTAEEQSSRLMALMLVNKITFLLSQPGTGRLYDRGRTKKGYKRKPHRASAPGEPPAVDTGRLRASIGFERLGPWTYRVGTGVEYAGYLEFGTIGPEYTGGRILPRPFMRPALAAVKGEWTGVVVSELRR